MAGLQEAFERAGAGLEHHLMASHAAGAALAVTDRDEILGVAVRGMSDVASAAPVRPETRSRSARSRSRSPRSWRCRRSTRGDSISMCRSTSSCPGWGSRSRSGPSRCTTSSRTRPDCTPARKMLRGSRAHSRSSARIRPRRRPVSGTATRTTATRSWAPCSKPSRVSRSTSCCATGSSARSA